MIYQKHDSFAGVRHQAPLPDVLGRIRTVQKHLAEFELSPYAKSLVDKACDELLGKAGGRDGHQPFVLHSYVIEEISRLTDAELPRYLFYRYRYETFSQRRILDDFPPCLQIEPTSICNYRCVFCYQTDRHFTEKNSRHMGVMSLDMFKRVVDQAEGRCEAISLASRGEPLICPEVDRMLDYASGKFLALKLNTNASFLDGEKSHAILQADINTLVFSVDAVSEPEYSRLRVGGKLEHVLRNIALFRDIRAKCYPKSRTITRVAGVRVAGTPDLDQMEEFWGGLVDQVAFVAYNPWENVYERPPNGLTTPCSDLWRRMFVWFDGTVNPCDVDYKSTLAIGYAAERSLSELWQSPAYMRLREQHVARQRSQCSPCSRCVVV